MNLIAALFFGFISALIGAALPGLINMTAAKVNLKEGKESALWFVFGAVIVLFIQVYLSILFARFIDKHSEIVLFLREIGFVVFSLLTIYFLWIAEKPRIAETEIKKQTKTTRFFLGMLLSVLNFFPIPYYVLISIALSSYDLFNFDTLSNIFFVCGVMSASFLVFYFYMIFAQKIQTKTDYMFRNMNTIIGSITGFISVITLFNIVKFYWE